MRTSLPLAIAVVVLAGGCHHEKPQSKPPERSNGEAAAEPAAPAADGEARTPEAGAMPTPSKDGLVSLSTDPNPYIRNNAKHALSSWERKDYIAVAIGMRKLMNLCRSTSQQEAALSSLAQLKLEIDAAAAKGNANAKAAAAQLVESGPL